MITKFKDHEDRLVEQLSTLKSKGGKDEALKKDRELAENSPDLLEPSWFDEDVMKLSGGGDWHTAYILLYGPRKLMKYEKENKEESEKASENMEATSGDSKEEQKMETS